MCRVERYHCSGGDSGLRVGGPRRHRGENRNKRTFVSVGCETQTDGQPLLPTTFLTHGHLLYSLSLAPSSEACCGIAVGLLSFHELTS